MSTIHQRIEQAIPAEWHMISGSDDSQTSADVHNVNKFSLPNPAGKAGGACTSAFLQVLYKDHAIPQMQLSWVTVLRQMRQVLRSYGYNQIPQLTSSRYIDVHTPMYICPPNHRGTKRAVLIGINYVGQPNGLTGCHNDVRNIKEYLERVHGFEERNMLILMDDGWHHPPTRKNIMDSFERLVQYSQPGDVLFIHYSGHGGQVIDTSGDEADGYDETIYPVDFRSSGQIIDDELCAKLVRPMRWGVTASVLMDCCHSGTVLDLPYIFKADGDQMKLDQSFNLENFLGNAETLACCACLALLLATMVDG